MNFEMPNRKDKKNQSDALAEITIIEQQARVQGANDYEQSAFKLIRKQLEGGNLTPQEAILRAQAILDSKQDYH